MNVGEFVCVSPHHSLKFAGWVGKIINIVPEDGLYLKVQFEEDGWLYGFTSDEVMQLKTLDELGELEEEI